MGCEWCKKEIEKGKRRERGDLKIRGEIKEREIKKR